LQEATPSLTVAVHSTTPVVESLKATDPVIEALSSAAVNVAVNPVAPEVVTASVVAISVEVQFGHGVTATTALAVVKSSS
jgi:hypothetical protein